MVHVVEEGGLVGGELPEVAQGAPHEGLVTEQLPELPVEHWPRPGALVPQVGALQTAQRPGVGRAAPRLLSRPAAGVGGRHEGRVGLFQQRGQQLLSVERSLGQQLLGVEDVARHAGNLDGEGGGGSEHVTAPPSSRVLL